MLVLCSPHRWFISLSLLLIKHRVVIITLWGKWLHLLVTLHIKNGASYWCKFECHDFRHIETRGNVLTRWLSLVFLSGVGVVAQLNPDNLTTLGPLRIGRGVERAHKKILPICIWMKTLFICDRQPNASDKHFLPLAASLLVKKGVFLKRSPQKEAPERSGFSIWQLWPTYHAPAGRRENLAFSRQLQERLCIVLYSGPLSSWPPNLISSIPTATHVPTQARAHRAAGLCRRFNSAPLVSAFHFSVTTRRRVLKQLNPTWC